MALMEKNSSKFILLTIKALALITITGKTDDLLIVAL